MSFSTSARFLPHRFRLVLDSFLQSAELPFADALPAEKIESLFAEEEASFAHDDDAVYTPAITLWAFLSQVLFKGEQHSCRAAVARVVVLWAALGKQVSGNTGAYCRARAKVRVIVIQRLTLDLAKECEDKIRQDSLWYGRHVFLIDGTTVSMPDEAELQEKWPQSTAQAEGLGFPIARMVLLFSLATGMVAGMAMGPYAGKETGETALFRELLDGLSSGSIILGDRYFCSYFMVALLKELGVDVVTRLHQMRPQHFRGGRRLGKGDRIVRWQRPARPHWMDEDTYQRMPESMEVRQVKIKTKQPGFRVESLIVVATLIDASQYPPENLAALYHERWLAELDIRAIKVTLNMDVLRCKSPEMIEREIWTCLLAYNLIRQTILQAAQTTNLSPRQLSFTAAMQSIAAAYAAVLLLNDRQAPILLHAHLKNLAIQRVGNRPHRVEPRAIKRRPKPHDLLTQPRDEARAKLLRPSAA